ncbi:MAG: EamA family transporter [Maricaulaceae bacterium]
MSPDSAAALMALGSAACHAVFNAALRRDGDRYARRGGMNALAALIALPFLFVFPPPGLTAGLHLAASVGIMAVYQIAQIESYKRGGLSTVYPITRGAGVALTALGAALIFQEPFPPLKILGFAIAVAALLTFARGEGAASRSAIAWALITASCIMIYTLNDGAGVKAASTFFSYAAWFFVLQGWIPLAVAWRARGSALPGLLKQEAPIAALGAGLMLATYSLNLAALRLGNVAEVAALRELSVPLAAFLGAWLFHERLGGVRVLAACVLAGGLVVIRLS